MCGIIHVKRLDGKKAAKMVEKRYHKQKSRGTDGFGYVSIRDGRILDYVRATGEKEILKALKDQDGSEVMFHHRYPTSTPNFIEAAHPIKVSNKLLKHDYYVVHNGIIYGDSKLKDKHEKMGFTYTTNLVKKWRSGGNTIFRQEQWNDSESLAIELALDLDGKQEGLSLDGSIAFIALQAEKGSRKVDRLFFGRNYSNPLKIKRTEQAIVIASEGEGDQVEAHTLHTLEYATNEITKKKYELGEADYPEYYGGAWHNRKQSVIGFDTQDRDRDIEDVIAPELRDPRDKRKLGDDLPIDCDLTENDYIEMCNEYGSLQAMFSREDIDETRQQTMLDRLIELEDDIAEYEHQHFGARVTGSHAKKR